MRKSNDAVTLLAVDVLERPPLPAVEPDEDLPEPEPLDFPARVRGRYASLAVNSDRALIRLLSFPGRSDADIGHRVVEGLALENPDDYRISYNVLTAGAARADTRVVAVALPEDEAFDALGLLPRSGTPAPYSLEISGLASLTAFANGPVAAREDDTVGILVFGESSSLLALFRGGQPVLIRKLDRGTRTLLDRVVETLGVNAETAEGILADGSFDISPAVSDVMEPLVKQLIVSRDFVERRENCRVDGLYLCGGLVVSRDVQNEIQSSTGLDVAAWNPLDDVPAADDAVPEALGGQSWRFSAAIGACLATFETT